MQPIPPLTSRDFRSGRYTKSHVSAFLIPENSVANTQNVNYDDIIGLGKVRSGTTKLGNTVASNRAPLGMHEFVGPLGTPNLILVVFKGASNATLYYYNGSWNASDLTALSNTARNRFATLGGRAFITNGVDGMASSNNGSAWTPGGNSIPTTIKPTLIKRYAGKLLCAGDPANPDRIWFSSVINPAANPFITWNIDPEKGDFIDVNPDDNGNLTGFSETSTYLLVFKDTYMYRLDVLTKTADPESIVNIGAVSQEAITLCQGITYFYSGKDIRKTDGGYPTQISRAGVQDFLDAIPEANRENVTLTSDENSVRVFIGDVTLNNAQDGQKTYNNVCLKYSPRDQNWSVHTYDDEFQRAITYTDSNGTLIRAADIQGDVQTLDLGTSDNGAPIYYFLESQDLEFGNRAHRKQMSDKIAVFTRFGQDSQLQVIPNGKNAKSVQIELNADIAIGNLSNLEGQYFTVRWMGNTINGQKAPIFEGFYIEKITDLGFTK